MIFPYAKEYLQYLDVERGLAKGTIEKYLAELCAFMLWLESEYGMQMDLQEISIMHIRRFLSYLKNELCNKPVTRNNKLGVLGSYFGFLVLIDVLDEDDNPLLYIKRVKEPKLLPVFLTLEEAEALLLASQKSKMPLRDYAILRFFLQTGCRMAELISLELSLLDLTLMEVRLLGKGNKERIVPLTVNTCAAIKEYLNVRKPLNPSEQAVFLNSRGKPISGVVVRQLFKKICAEAGLIKPSLSPIKLRHTCMTLLLKEGVSLTILKEIAGHGSIRTTRRYTHVTQMELRKAITKFPLG